MALMLLQVLVLGVIVAADDAPVTWYWSSRALVPCAVPNAARATPRRPPPLLDDAARRSNPYTWRHDDAVYHANRVLSNGTLDVRRREGGDGIYQCSVRTQPGTVLGYPVLLRTAHMEKFSTHPEDTEARAGQPATLSCGISSEPPAAVSWSRDGKNLPADDRYYLLKDQLLITDVRAGDAGLYRCTATNDYLNKSRTSHGGRLKVGAAESTEPSILSTFEDRELMVAEGARIRLPCAVTGWPRPELTWELVSPGGFTSVLDATDQVLQRSDMEPAQEGQYTCRVKGRSDLQKSFNVTVTRPVNITLPPASKEALRASTVRFSCSADGRPAPNVTWYKDGTPLALTGRVGLRKSPEEDRIELVISGVTSHDAGVYQCFARNNVSTSSAWASLSVTGKGAAPPARVACEPLGARAVAVRWTPVPERVFAYTVHTTPQEKHGMSLPGQPHVNTQEIVTVPKPLTPYLFQVRAYVQSSNTNAATDFSEAVVCQGQGVPFKLMKLDPGSLLVSWRAFAEETPGVMEWLVQWRSEPGAAENNVTLPAGATNYTLPLEADAPLQVRVLGSRSVPWLPQNLSRVPWLPAELSGDASAMARDLTVTQVGPRGFTVRWKTDDLTPGSFGWLVCVTKIDGNEECQPGYTNSTTIKNLQPDSEYEVRVLMRIPGREEVETVLPDHIFTLPEGSASFKLTYKYVNSTTLRVSWRGEPARYNVYHTTQRHLPVEAWQVATVTGNTVLLTGIDSGAETYVRVKGPDTKTESQLLRVPPQPRDLDAKDLTYVYTSNGVTVSWVGAGPRVVRFSQNITRPLEAWHQVNVTEPHVQLWGLDRSLPTYVAVTAPGSGRPAQVLSVPARPPDPDPVPLVVGISCLVGVLVLVIAGAVCFWRRRKMAQSPARSRRRNTSPTGVAEGESSEMKAVGGRLANGAAGEPLLNGHVHITENPTSKTPNGKMRKARYEAFDVSRHDADTTATTLADSFDTSRRKLPDDNMNSERAPPPLPNG